VATIIKTVRMERITRFMGGRNPRDPGQPKDIAFAGKAESGGVGGWHVRVKRADLGVYSWVGDRIEARSVAPTALASSEGRIPALTLGKGSFAPLALGTVEP
jgi:hypothetical protein